MASGFKEMVLNTQERIISTDYNRSQKFKGADVAELWRYMLDTTANDDLDAGSVAVEYSTTEAPMRAEIINGLLVQPQAGSFNLLVTPGVMLAIHPDSAPDDSNYKYVRDPGVSVLGALTVTSNSSGSPRVDIVECQDASQILETDNRDLFNATTGLFTASTVTKAVGQRLSYRVRAGTPGAGIPANVTGWLPLAVILVPNGAASLDTCTLWDVRPLVHDRAHGATSPLLVDKPWLNRLEINASAPSATAGVVDAVMGTDGTLGTPISVSGRRIGGRLRRGTPGTDAQSIDLTDSINQEDGFSAVASRPWYLYLTFPGGLPRWARYTDGPIGRVPRSPRGIPVLAMGTPPDTSGSQVITLSSAIFGVATNAPGYAVAAGYINQSSAISGVFGGLHEGQRLYDSRSDDNPAGGNPISVAGTTGVFSSVGVATFTTVPGTHYPPHAREILCDIVCTVSHGSGGTDGAQLRALVRIYAPNGGAMISSLGGSQLPRLAPGSSGAEETRFWMWLPVPSVYPSLTVPTTQVFDVRYSTTGPGTDVTAMSGANLRILGWRF